MLIVLINIALVSAIATVLLAGFGYNVTLANLAVVFVNAVIVAGISNSCASCTSLVIVFCTNATTRSCALFLIWASVQFKLILSV